MPFEFKPSGFDVCPEMARVYAALSAKLQADINAKTTENTFPKVLLGDETEVSNQVAKLDSSTDLTVLKKLAVYGRATPN